MPRYTASGSSIIARSISHARSIPGTSLISVSVIAWYAARSSKESIGCSSTLVPPSFSPMATLRTREESWVMAYGYCFVSEKGYMRDA